MNIRSLSGIKQYPAISKNYNNYSNITFGNETPEFKTTLKGDKYAKVDILGKTYLFKKTDEIENIDSLEPMINNIKGTMTGYFIKNGKHEYFIPNILKKVPNISNAQLVVEHGNAVTEINDDALAALGVMKLFLGENVDIKKLKTIKYLRKPITHYANNTVEMAYSYFDDLNNDLYLYIPKNKKIQIKSITNYIKNYKIQNICD